MKVEYFEEAYNWKKPEDLYKICIEQQQEIERLNKSLEEQRHFYLEKLQQKENIIKEVREYIENNLYGDYGYECKQSKKELLEILNKGE